MSHDFGSHCGPHGLQRVSNSAASRNVRVKGFFLKIHLGNTRSWHFRRLERQLSAGMRQRFEHARDELSFVKRHVFFHAAPVGYRERAK
jgi:hypothetical protein